MPEFPRRCKRLVLAALAASSLLLADPGHAASLLLTSTLGDAHTCQAIIWRRHDWDVIARSDYLRVDSWGARFEFGKAGDFAVDADGDTPKFGALTLTCWAPATNWPGTRPPAGTPSYSLTLGYDSRAWDVPGANGIVHVLPRDGRMLHLEIERTAAPSRLFRITNAALRVHYQAMAEDIEYGALMHRYFLH